MTYDPPGAHGEAVPTRLAAYPGMTAFSKLVIDRFGGRSLGIYSNRDIRGGTSTSLHAVSRAFDWSYPNRVAALAAMAWLTGPDGQAGTYGVQAIHDYADHRDGLGHTWGHGRGWHYASIGPVGGRWLHLELTVAAARAQHPTPRPPTQESDDMLAGFFRHDGIVCAVQTGGYKVHVPNPGALKAAQALASLGGHDPTVHDTADVDMWRAFGPLLDPVPNGYDRWGCRHG